MNKPKIICLGEILFDLLADGVGQSFNDVRSWTAYPGGAPANVACGLVKLGTRAAFVGCVGKDPEGTDLVTLLQTLGVDISGIQYHPNAPNRKVYVLRDTKGDRTFAGFGTHPADRFADAFLDAQLLPEDLFRQAEFLVLGTLELAYPQTRAAIFHALDLAKLYHLKVVLDLNWRPNFWRNSEEAKPLIQKLWQYTDFLKLSKEEAQLFFNTNNPRTIAKSLESIQGVIVTAGNEPINYHLGDCQGIVSPHNFEVKDTTGAGDAFLAGFIHHLSLQGMTRLNDPQVAKEIISYAAIVGGLTTTNLGAIAAQPTAEQVAEFLRSGLC